MDWLKFFLIALVVLGHAIQWQRSDFLTHWLWIRIYAFHMPAFFFMSGYFFFKDERSFVSDAIRLLGLIVPYLSWYALATPHMMAPLWFLSNLSIFILAAIFLHLVARRCGLNELFVVVFMLSLFSILGLFNGCRLPYVRTNLMPFFFMGYFAKSYNGKIGRFIYRPVFFNSCLICAACGMLLMGLVTGIARSTIRGVIAITMTFGMFSFCIWLFSRLKMKYSNLWIGKIGEMTLGIYACHPILLNWLSKFASECHYVIVFLAVFALSVVSCWLLNYVPILNLMLLGNTRQVKSLCDSWVNKRKL